MSNYSQGVKLTYALAAMAMVLIGCGQSPPTPVPITQVATKTAKDTLAIFPEEKDRDSSSHIPPTDSAKNPVLATPYTFFVGRLGLLEDKSGYHVPIYLKKEMREEAVPAIYEQPYEPIYATENEKRSIVPIELVEKYFLTEGLQELWVFNEALEVIDSLQLQDFEYLEESTSSSFVATYASASKNLQQLTAITKTPGSLHFLKAPSPAFKSASNLLEGTLTNNHLTADHTTFEGSSKVGKDQFLLASFSNYTLHQDAIYLFKNGTAVDSITKDYYMQNLRALPISTNSSGFYTADCGIPETDAHWCQLIEIEWHTGKLILHECNRAQTP